MEAVTTRLPNGIVLHHYPASRFKTVTVVLSLQQALGSDVARTAVLPFLLRRGCHSYPSMRELSVRLDELYGARLQPEVLKIGERQVACLTLELADERFLPDGAGLLRECLALLGQVLAEPNTIEGGFQPEYLAGERDNLIRQVESLVNDKRAYAVHRLREEMCRGEAFARHKYGTVAELSALDPVDLLGYYRRLLRENPLDLFVVGGGKTADVAELAAQMLNVTRTGEVELPPTLLGEEPGKPREVLEEQPVNQAKLCMGFRMGITYADESYTALAVANGILGGYPHSKLFQEVREKASLAYYATSQLEATKGLLIVSAGINAADFPRTRDLILEQLAALQRGEITDQELEHTRKAMERGLLATEDVPVRLVQDDLVGIINGHLEGVPERLTRLAEVSREQVVEASQHIHLDTVYLLAAKGVA